MKFVPTLYQTKQSNERGAFQWLTFHGDLPLQAAVDTKRMMPGQKAETISILHFNDVYNVESREVEPVGGAARWLSSFVAALSRNE